MGHLAPCLENDTGGAGIRLQMNYATAATVVGDATKYYHVQAQVEVDLLCPFIELLLKKF